MFEGTKNIESLEYPEQEQDLDPSLKQLCNWISQLESYKQLNFHRTLSPYANKFFRAIFNPDYPEHSSTVAAASCLALSHLSTPHETDKKVQYLDRCEISHDVLQNMDQMTDTLSIIECAASVREKHTMKRKSKSEAWTILIPLLQQYAHLRKLSICSSVIDLRAVKSICICLPHIIKLHLPKNSVSDQGAQLIVRYLLDLQILSLWSNSLTDVGARSLTRGLYRLRELNVGMNHISSEGIIALAAKRPNLSMFVIFGNTVDGLAELLIRGMVSPTTEFVF